MRILDWLKNILSKSKNNYMLNEQNSENKAVQNKREFVTKVDVNNVEHKKTREDILRDLREDMIVENFSEEYNYERFSSENIRKQYDMDSILSDEDMMALECLHGAIKEGNESYITNPEIENGELRTRDNKINDFLSKSSDNIIVLINLMKKSAENLYENLDNKTKKTTTVQGLIPGSYSDVSQLIEDYEKESEIEMSID